MPTYKYPVGNKFSEFTLFADTFSKYLFIGKIINFYNVNFAPVLLRTIYEPEMIREAKVAP